MTAKLLDTLHPLLSQHQPRVIEQHYPEAAVLVAISDDADRPGVLLTKRAQHLAIHSGEVAFPGGKRDAEDASLLQTALREAEEEVALPRRCFQFAGCLDQRITRSNIKVTPFVGIIPQGIELTANQDELDSLFYTPIDFFLDPGNLHIDKIPYRGELKYIPRFEFEQYSVWGVTAMIVVDLMNTVFAAGLPVRPSEGASS